MASNRKSNRSPERFARIPVSVLESPAATSLNYAAFKVLVILASQWHGGNNGTLALTEFYARRFGFSGRDTLYRSLRELESRGLIVCTRRGMKMKKQFTLWALGWESITHREGKPLDVPEPNNNSRWLNWQPPAPKPESHCDQNTAEIHTERRECTVPMVGNDQRVSVPTLIDRLPLSVPTIGNTSRVLAGGARSGDPPPALSSPTHETDRQISNDEVQQVLVA